MNCDECVSKKVCFVQNQIEGLASRMIQPPFFEVVGVEACRTKSGLQRSVNRTEKQYNLEHELRGTIAAYCPFFPLFSEETK